MTSSTEQTDTVVDASAMETSADVTAVANEEKPVDHAEEETAATETKTGKRKRATKPSIENDDGNMSIASGRPKRTLSKREEMPMTTAPVNGSTKVAKSKAPRQSDEQPAGDADDEQDHDKNIPIAHDVADVVWAKMGGHPWWPSLIIRDPNDASQSFTKITGNARPKRLYFVAFYGSTADFAWVSDAAIIPYEGVEAFTKYAQETVDKAATKSQKEQLTERFQLKVTIGRREDWEMAVREADAALKQVGDSRVQEIQPKIEFYTKKIAPTNKGQPGRRPKASITKPDEPSAASNPDLSSLNPADRSLLAEKTFEFKSDDENDSSLDTPLRKPTIIKIQPPKETSNGTESSETPSKKSRISRQTEETTKTTVFGQTANGSSVSYQQRAAALATAMETPVKAETTTVANGGSGKKRGRPSSKQTTVSSSSEESPTPEFHSASPTVTTKFTSQRKPIVKPQAFSNSSANNNNDGKHDSRTGFLSASEEQEVLDALDQLPSTKTFEDAEQVAKRRFEHILCLNLNRTHVDVPEEWFYTFLFTHPSVIMKNSHWFKEKAESESLNENDLLANTRSSSSLAVLKHQLVVLSKLYRNELQSRQSAPVKKRPSTGGSLGKQKSVEAKVAHDGTNNDSAGEELIN